MLLWKKDGEEIFVPKISSVRFESVKNKAMKYFYMLKAFKNIKKTDNSLLKTKH